MKMFLSTTLVFALAVSVFAGDFMAGGITEIEETQDVRNAAHFATDTINSEDKELGSKWHTLTKINNPTQQVVNGMNYRMEIVLKESDCRNHESNNGATLMDCPPVMNGSTKRCLVQVWHQHHRTPQYTLEKEMCMED